MKIFQLKSFYFDSKMGSLRSLLLPIIVLYCVVNLSAQNEPNVKLKVEAGLNWKPAERNLGHWNWGQIYSLEPKLQTSERTFIGLRIQASENHPSNEKYKPTQFFIDNNINVNLFPATSSTLISIAPTFDYYFGMQRINPYLGTGFGVYMLAPPLKFLQQSTAPGVLETSVDNQVGFLIRGGIYIGKLTVGLEFNQILEADIKAPNGLIIGTVDDSFFALLLGYTFGFNKRLK